MIHPSRRRWSCLLGAVVFSLPQFASAVAQEMYNPVWGSDLGWTSNNLFNRPAGSQAYWENEYLPWWQTRTAHPIADYDASKLPVGGVRFDANAEVDYTMHNPLAGWAPTSSPSGINNLYACDPNSSAQQFAQCQAAKTQAGNKGSGRSGQEAFLDLGVHPIAHLSADVGLELIGNYDQRYWFPVNDEHRLSNNDQAGRVTRGEIKYDNGDFMLRGFEGVPVYGWMGQNDLFGLLPSQRDVEYYRTESGVPAPRGGEMRWKSLLGTLDVIGGTEVRWGYGPSVYAKYDAPTFRSLEQSLVYRSENIPFGFEDPGERRWSLSYNASYPWTDRITSHAGVLYQPFRLNRPYQDPTDVGANGIPQTRMTHEADALGFTTRTEVVPQWSAISEVGLGYMYLGPVAGDKHQVDLDVSKTMGAFTLAGAYIYRQPVVGPVPLLYEGTAQNQGAIVASPRGPDDPFWVQWDNRKANIFALTFLYDPTPGTPFFKYQRNVLEDWNINPDEDATWVGAIQYRLTDYLTNTDRSYYWDEDRQIIWDPIAHNGAYASAHPLSSFSGLVHWKPSDWRFSLDCSAGEAMAGLDLAYTTATDFYKPTTIFISAGGSASNGPFTAFARFGQDVWGPVDYQIQNGWTYHKIYEAGLSYNFFRDFQAGFRYIGTRMTPGDFIGSDVGAFNEYTLFMSYHFTLEHNFASALPALGRAIPQTLPQSGVSVSEARFTPDGSGPTREITITPHASADAGVLSWKLLARNAAGETVRQWEGSGSASVSLRWDGLGSDGKLLPAGTYRLTLNVVDLYGNEVTSPAQSVVIASGTQH